MNTIYKTDESNAFAGFVTVSEESFPLGQGELSPTYSFDVLKPLRQWLDQIQIHDPKTARFLSRVIPAQCPFERDIVLFGHKVGHIPPLCKLNPFYEQLVGLRFRALCFLADQCAEDIRSYC
jgi:hypothetical protein